MHDLSPGEVDEGYLNKAARICHEGTVHRKNKKPEEGSLPPKQHRYHEYDGSEDQPPYRRTDSDVYYRPESRRMRSFEQLLRKRHEYREIPQDLCQAHAQYEEQRRQEARMLRHALEELKRVEQQFEEIFEEMSWHFIDRHVSTPSHRLLLSPRSHPQRNLR